MEHDIEQLKPGIKEAAKRIQKAVEDRALIIIRHHADCDGYCGALAIEEIIYPIIKNENSKPWQKYKRLPMRTPFYDYPDALRDLSFFKDNLEYDKKPLLVIIDNGSGEEDLLALKRIKMYNISIIILDHHVFSKEVDQVVDIHLNPRKIGATGDITSGMLGFEVANILGKANPLYAALSGVSDKSSDNILKPYMSLVPKKPFLEKLAKCVDFEAYNTRFMESDLIYDLFNDNQKKIMDILLPEIDKREEEYEKVIQKFLKKEAAGKIKLFSFDIGSNSIMGEYPTAGKLVGIAHRMNTGSRITIGHTDNFMSFRIDNLDFSISEILKILKQKIPFGKIGGGGHDYAGTIKFIPSVKEQVLKELVSYIKKIK